MSALTGLSWESASFFTRAKQWVGLASSPSQILQNKLNQSDAKNDALQEAVAYLSAYSNKALYKAVENTLQKASLSQVKSLCSMSLSSGRLRMLDVCQKILSLEQLKILSEIKDPLEHARREASFIQEPKRSLTVISSSFSQYLKMNSESFEKITRYFTTTLAWSYSIDLEAPPRSNWAAQGQMNFMRTTFTDVVWLTKSFIQLFATTWKAALAGAGVLVSLAGFGLLYSKFRMGTPDTLHTTYFRNLNREARAGSTRNTIGREKEISEVESCLSSPPGQKPRIPVLVGPPGVGKTQLMEGLAQKIERKEAHKLNGKRVLAVNTASLIELGAFSEGGYATRSEELFKLLNGFEDQIILFFDEAHNAATAAFEGAPPLLETLKTKLLERNILCVFATTTEEYDATLASNKAFQDRITRINIPNLGDVETKLLLQERFGNNSPVEIDHSAYDTVLQVAAEHRLYKDRTNPRKSADLLQDAVNRVYTWSPRKLDAEIEKLDKECRALTQSCRTARDTTPGWAATEEGKGVVDQLKKLNENKEALEQKKLRQTALIGKIDFLRKLLPEYRNKEYELIHLLAKQGKTLKTPVREEAEKHYLFLQHILLPQLREQIELARGELQEQFQEEMPLKVDAKLLNSLFCTRQNFPLKKPKEKITGWQDE